MISFAMPLALPRTIRILQISDLWVPPGAARQATEAVELLTSRISGRVEYIAVCGNLTVDGSRPAFGAALELLRQLTRKLLASPSGNEDDVDYANRLLVVPGTRDIPDDDWTNFRTFYGALYRELFGVKEDRSLDWGDDPKAPRAWVRDLYELTAVGLPAWAPASDDAGRERRADQFRDAIRDACDRLSAVSYSRYTPSLVVSSESPLFCPYGRARMSEESIGPGVQQLAPDLHLFGQSPVVCLRSEPFVFKHTALSTGPVSGYSGNDWPDRANLIDFWPRRPADVGQAYLGIRRYERAMKKWEMHILTEGGWDDEFPKAARAGPPADLPSIIEHRAFYEALRDRVRAGYRVIRMECLPGTGIPFALSRLAAEHQVRHLLSDWPVFVAYAAVTRRADEPNVEGDREQMGEVGENWSEIRSFPGLQQVREQLKDALHHFDPATSPAATVLLVMWDGGPEEDLPQSFEWTTKLRHDVIDFIAPPPAAPAARSRRKSQAGPTEALEPRTVFLYLRRVSRPRRARLPLEPGLRIGSMEPVPYAPLLSGALSEEEPLTAVVPIDRRELGALSGGYLGLAARYVRRAREELRGSPGSRQIRAGSGAVLRDPGDELLQEWRDFRRVLEEASPPTAGVDPGHACPWMRPTIAQYFAAFVHRRLNHVLAHPVQTAPDCWPAVEFLGSEFRAIARIPVESDGDWVEFRDRLLQQKILRALGPDRFRVNVLAPFIRAPERFPIFVSFSRAAGHVEWLQTFIPLLESEWGQTRGKKEGAKEPEGFLDLWTYVNEQYDQSGSVHQIYEEELARRNNFILVFADKVQFNDRAWGCVAEVEYWWESWKKYEEQRSASFSHVQLGAGKDLSTAHTGKRARLPKDPKLPLLDAVVRPIIKRLKPDRDR